MGSCSAVSRWELLARPLASILHAQMPSNCSPTAAHARCRLMPLATFAVPLYAISVSSAPGAQTDCGAFPPERPSFF